MAGGRIDIPRFLTGGGELGALIAAHDWGATSLGPIGSWPQSLKSATALMLRSAVPMVMLWGTDGVMLYNDAYSVIAGGRHPGLLGSKVREGWPEVADFNDHVMQVGLAGGTLAYRDQQLTLHRHGRPEQVWMNLDYSPLIDESGEPAGVLAVVVETTARKVAEASLAESEARFRNMADHAPVMMWITDVSGSCTYLNRRWHDFTGQTAAQALGFGWLDATHPEDRNRASEAFHDANAARAPFRVEYRLRRADGTYRWAIDAASPRFGEDGLFAGYVGSVIDIEERREAELALEAATVRAEALAAQQAAILGQLAEGVIVTDRDGKITFVNTAAARIHGVARLDVEPDAYSETYHLLDLEGRPHPPLELPLARAVRKGETVSEAAWRIQRPDGSRVLAVGSARPVLDASGDQIGAVLTLRDDTDRAAAEDLVRESEARLRALTDNLPSGMVFQIASGRDGVERRFVYVSQSNEKLTGVPASDVLANPGILYGLIVPEHRAAMLEAEQRAVRGRTPFDVQVQIRRTDGEVRWTRIISAPREQADGSLVWDGIQIDITEQKNAETQLREWNETLESRVVARTAERDRMWSTSPDLMLIIGFDGVFLRVNPAWTAVLGYREDELVGRHVNEFVVPEDHDRTVDSVAMAAAGGRPRIENRYRHRDGSIRWIAWVAAPAGDVTYATGRDVTAEKARQAALEAAEDALRQSQKMEAVGQLTGGLAHDFNNLLAAISGSFEMLARKWAAGRLDETERFLQLGQQATRKAAALTHRLLAFSRRQTLEPKLFDVNRLVAGLEDLIRRTIGPAIEIRVVAAVGIWNVFADPLQLENALLNLCINARDAMPTGGLLVIETANRFIDASSPLALDLQPGAYVSLCVRDDGVGMPPDVLARAFDPFFTTKPIGEGTGLGLSMVYGFAKQSLGHARIESDVGRGTRVCVFLPRDSTGLAPVDPASTTVADARTPPASRTIVVVDDEAMVRELVVQALVDEGHRVLEAATGAEAVEVLRAEPAVDLLITDVGLPGGLNGRQVAELARQQRPGLRVLFITGYAEHALLGPGHLDPGMQVLTKPFELDALVQRTEAMMEPAGDAAP